MTDFVRHRQRAVTAISPHQGNKNVLVPKRSLGGSNPALRWLSIGDQGFEVGVPRQVDFRAWLRGENAATATITVNTPYPAGFTFTNGVLDWDGNGDEATLPRVLTAVDSVWPDAVSNSFDNTVNPEVVGLSWQTLPDLTGYFTAGVVNGFDLRPYLSGDPAEIADALIVSNPYPPGGSSLNDGVWNYWDSEPFSWTGTFNATSTNTPAPGVDSNQTTISAIVVVDLATQPFSINDKNGTLDSRDPDYIPAGSAGQLDLNASYSVEDNRSVTFPVNRNNGDTGTVGVNWQITGANAADFSPNSGTIQFVDGETIVSIGTTCADLLSNGSAQLELNTPTGGATIGDSTAPISITDAPSSQVFFDGFESGGFGPEWSTVPKAEVITSAQGPVNAGNYAAYIPYDGSSYSDGSFDQNRQITIDLQSENLFNFSVDVDCYFASPNVVASRDDTIRKYFFLWSKASNNWAIIPGAPYGPATYNSIIWTTMQRYNPPFNDGYTNQPVRNSDFGVISTDQWFNLEVRIQVSDAGVANGWWQTLVNGVVVSELDNVNFNNSLKSPVGRIQIGTQYDMPKGSVVSWDEDRYFDNVRVTKNVSKA